MPKDDPPGGGWLRRLLPTHGLSPAEAAAVERERITKNIARARTAAPIMMFLLLSIALAMMVVSPQTDGQRRWQHGIAAIDLVSAVLLAVAAAAARSSQRTGITGLIRRNLGEVLMVLGVVIGAALVVNTLNYQFKMIAWVAVILLTSALFHPRPAVFFAAQLGGLATVLVAAFLATDETGALLGHTTTAVGSVVCVMIADRVAFAAFVRETLMRHQLAEMNRDLEHRVTQQVREIVGNNVRIEALNRQLAGKVAARSEELAAALRRLAVAEHGGETFTPGTVIGDRFEIKYVLGVGGMGVVYAAYDRLADQRVAVKVVRSQSGDVSGGVRFLQEATAAASLSHPAIVRVLHIDVTDDGRLYQALELIEGQTLDACIDRGRGLPKPVAARLGAVIADALAVAHALGIVHRDVKPQNIMITADAPGCRLLDFGLAKLRETMSHASLSEHGAVIGTPQFLAPEQVSTPLAVSGAADVYAFGTVLYLCLSGRLPFTASQPMQWLYAHVHDQPAPLTAADAPPALRALVQRCLLKNPADRPDARLLADELAAIADDLEAPVLEAWASTIEYVDTRPLMLPDIALPPGVETAAVTSPMLTPAKPRPASSTAPPAAAATTGAASPETDNLRLTAPAPLATSSLEATRE